jgi:hypothetical protein
MAAAKRAQNGLRSSPPSLETSPAQARRRQQEVMFVSWLWLNLPLDVLFFAAMSGIPLWLVLRHPDTGPAPRQAAAGYRPSNRDRYVQVGR